MPRRFWDFAPKTKAGVGMVNPAAAPGSGLGTLPQGGEGCPPIAAALLCQSQRGRRLFLCIPMLAEPLWHVARPFGQRFQGTRSSVHLLIPFSIVNGSDKLLNCS